MNVLDKIKKTHSITMLLRQGLSEEEILKRFPSEENEYIRKEMSYYPSLGSKTTRRLVYLYVFLIPAIRCWLFCIPTVTPMLLL